MLVHQRVNKSQLAASQSLSRLPPPKKNCISAGEVLRVDVSGMSHPPICKVVVGIFSGQWENQEMPQNISWPANHGEFPAVTSQHTLW